ncbi:mycofactocin-coupled SDR family oxidoreductase [Rhodococcus triatomae]|uniref:SDR family mycofactocin-dependent oxidoreductase n=1 Tax=Rhodococcus triatomae TaxID=300028 RepID=A0A1G8BB35_9NOCA|nr:mycofactocin-coupled SDR family oxidoreductase [Rhodococcus triatomae]QNG17476.1 mycofactocin-coupled SDR family oxidoreductase [Rhodococcus triatomae]QNG22856.1 mycofactocin-coupled SDR family oxidoreductase [Rhodococcus triatomae]SDH30425.1 SDR family mycofactocin-dependent oxidoreductase [Rhodococcus triatomae]
MSLSGKVAFVTGAAQSQGRSHAVRLAAEGADVIAVDICEQIDVVPYRMGDDAGLAETVRQVEAHGHAIHAARCDVRDRDALHKVVEDGIARFGRLDVVVANASVCSVQPLEDVTPEIWNTTLDVNLTGVWNTCAVAIPHLVSGGGGNIVITGSTGSVVGLPFYLPYVASKHALIGISRTLALELADRNIRVNTILPTGVDTPQGHSSVLPALLDSRPDLRSIFVNSLPVERIDAEDVTNAMMFLISDAARYVTGVAFPVDAGATIR